MRRLFVPTDAYLSHFSTALFVALAFEHIKPIPVVVYGASFAHETIVVFSLLQCLTRVNPGELTFGGMLMSIF